MTKMAVTPKYGKHPLESFSQESEGRLSWDLVFSIRDVGHTHFAQMIILVDLGLIYGNVNAFIWENREMFIFLKLFKPKS